jgi:hypothetical protein
MTEVFMLLLGCFFSGDSYSLMGNMWLAFFMNAYRDLKSLFSASACSFECSLSSIFLTSYSCIFFALSFSLTTVSCLPRVSSIISSMCLQTSILAV